MVIRKKCDGRRRGAVATETALVLAPVLTLIFGVFEFSRLLMAWNLLDNAAREGCRYAVVHNIDSTVTADVQSTVTKYMAGQSSAFSGFNVSLSGTHQGVATAVNNLTAGDMLTVTVSGTYHFMKIVPFVKLPTSLTITSAVIMGCEGGV
jgi:Flp pilus assembly protein TadG